MKMKHERYQYFLSQPSQLLKAFANTPGHHRSKSCTKNEAPNADPKHPSGEISTYLDERCDFAETVNGLQHFARAIMEAIVQGLLILNWAALTDVLHHGSLVVIVILGLVTEVLRTILTNWNLDPLACECLT